MQDKPAPPKKIAIVGAGIGGLTLAIALRHRGIDCTVFERQPQLHEVGAGITLWANAIRVLQALGIEDSVRAVSHVTSAGVIGLSDGRSIATPSLADWGTEPHLGQLWTLHRAELQQALYQALPKDTVVFNAPFERFEATPGGVRGYFSGHPACDASLLVGADGLRSTVRRQLLGDEPLRYAGYVCWRGVCAAPAGWRGTNGEFWGKGDRFGVVQIPGRRVYWFAVVNQSANQGVSAPHKARLQERFAHYQFDVPQLIEATPESAILYHELFDRPPLAQFGRGAVCLLGDAAHPTTPNLGQGAAMAMESAVVLSRVLAETPHAPDAIALYSRLRCARTAKITQTSRRLGALAQLSNPLLRSLRNIALSSVPAQARQRQLRELVEYDAAQVALHAGA
jgi:2-polyprenyl-6-methoxyphenol hydroxylase-like FAD-dependent oxidoreductase